MAGDLTSVRLKFKRARTHLDTLNAALDNAHGTANLYGLACEPDVEPGYYVVKVLQSGDAEEWPLLLGDFLHNLRSVLDHLAWQLVVANGNKPGRPLFPITLDPAWFDSKGTEHLTGVHPDAIAAIRALQPFDSSFTGRKSLHPLWLLSELDNVDKHRLVHILTFMPTESTLRFAPEHIIPDENVEMFDLSDRPIENGTKVARVRFHRHPKLEVNSTLTMNVLIEETRETPRLEWGVLDAMRDSVDDAVRALTPYVVWPPPSA